MKNMAKENGKGWSGGAILKKPKQFEKVAKNMKRKA